MGTLYVVATPIGNLDDITQRALTVMRDVRVLAAEDTRRTRQMLTHFGISRPLVSYHAFNERARRTQLLAALAEGDVAIVTDAGTPGIADPAMDVVRAALAAGHTVSPVPGPSALTAAASASGLIDGPFMMLGFLPRGARERQSLLGRAAGVGMPLICFESPNRTAATLAEMAATLGDRDATVMRELTKLHEEVRGGRLTALAAHFSAEEPRGEVVIVVAGEAAREGDVSDDEAVVRGLLGAGMKPSDAAREAAAITGRPRSDMYALAQRLRREACSS